MPVQLKYVLVLALTVAAAVAETAQTQPEQQQPPANDAAATAPASTVEPTWTEVIECYKKPQAANGCLESRMGRALVSLRDSVVGMARSDPDTATEDVTGVGNLVQQIGEFISYSMSSYFHGKDEDAVYESSSGAPYSDQTKDLDEGRGHHKKKKIQKEIKKFVLKVLFGIYLFKQKIKMILMSIQSILMSKFLIIAMIYALSNTFKIWYDIKQSKHAHHHDKVVYYENAHHQHHYEPPEHSEYDEHHHGWGDWGRSIAVTEPSTMEQSSGSIQHGGISRFIRRVSRTATSPGAAQDMAFEAQRPGQ